MDLLTAASVPATPTPGVGWLRIARWIGRKTATLIGLLIAVTVGCWVLMEISPIDPVDAYIGADVALVGSEQRALIAERWGLDRPPVERASVYFRQLAQGNFGTSIIYNQPVLDVIKERFVTSIWLMGTAWLLSGILGFTAGMVAAANAGKAIDRAIRWYAYTIASAPTFWVGLVMLSIFAVQLGWAPVCCAGPAGADPTTISLSTRFAHLALPTITLSLVGVAPIALHTRIQAADVLASDHVLFARAVGDGGWGLIVHRVLRNAAVPAALLQFASISELFGGAVLTEAVFSYPGLGEATVAAGVRGDVPLLIGIALFSALFVFVGNTIGDVVQAWLDPRVSLIEPSGEHRDG